MAVIVNSFSACSYSVCILHHKLNSHILNATSEGKSNEYLNIQAIDVKLGTCV